MYVYIILISAFLGWIVVCFGMILIIKPLKPISFLGFKIQGFIPAYIFPIFDNFVSSNSFKKSLQVNLENELLKPETISEVESYVSVTINKLIQEKINELFPVIKHFISDETLHKLKSSISESVQQELPNIFKKLLTQIEPQLDVNKIIREQILFILNHSMAQQVIKKVMLRLQLAGILIGIIIGLGNVLIVYYSK